MNKTAIKNFAVWARQKLIEDISYKAGLLGVSDKGIAKALPQSTNDLKFFDIGTKNYVEVSGKEIKQREALVSAIKAKERDTKNYKEAFEFIIEEVAYTWFNRLIAIRFMEVNEYLPSGVRVLSSENIAKTEPDLVTNPFEVDLNLSSYEQDKILELKEQNKSDELFRMLFIKQCNKLHEVLPLLFEKTDDYSELLLSISFTDSDGVIYHLTHDIAEDDFDIKKEGQIEIIGWMYQYYNIEPKAAVFARAKGKKIKKEQVPAATQLFTPEWIVCYMVENSLGRLWYEGHRDSKIKDNWKYYIDEAKQEPEVQAKLNAIKEEYQRIKPEDIKLIDPCMGSGHILVYAFDVLMQIYESYGYTQRDAASLIVENNIYGLDVDERAAQLAYFAVMMKGRQYDRRFLIRNLTPHIYDVPDIERVHPDIINTFGDCASIARRVCDSFIDGKEYGSLITPNVSLEEIEKLKNKLDEMDSNATDIFSQIAINTLTPIIGIIKILAQKYDVVITNPPYMAVSNVGTKLSDYVKKYYPDSKSDMFAVFMERCLDMGKLLSKISLVTPQSWMFLIAFNKMRQSLFTKAGISSLLHLGTGAFDEGFGTAAFILEKSLSSKFKGIFFDLRSGKNNEEKIAMIEQYKNCFVNSVNSISKLPNSVLAYWCPDQIRDLFINQKQIKEIFQLDCGIKNGKNDTFLRLWYEVSYEKINTTDSREESLNNMEHGKKKWFKCNKGGGYRKWYGNYEYVLNLENDAKDIRSLVSPSTYRLRKKENYFMPTITWPLVSGNKFGCRYMDSNILPDVNANIIVLRDNKEYYLMAYMNSKLFDVILDMLNPSLAFPIDTIASAPYIKLENEKIEELVKENIKISKDDWDSFECNWGFATHPLISLSKSYRVRLISDVFNIWREITENRYEKLKKNEEEINSIIIREYNLQGSISPEVSSEYMCISKADLERDIKSLISYAVGCIFGRYSLDEKGIICAGGEWDDSRYKTFRPDEDNCIPVTDEEYFEDDIVGRFCEFIKVVFGEESLEVNLKYIANALGNKGTSSRNIIRNYFLNDFIKDHIKIYQKRPIYWMFDSGKQKGFKALVYMHRWNADTTGNMRVEYLHRLQRVYDKEIDRMQEIIDSSHDNKEVNAATKRKEKLQKQLKETKDYDTLIAHLALSRIGIDLDDGVRVNYEKVQTANDGKRMQILMKI